MVVYLGLRSEHARYFPFPASRSGWRHKRQKAVVDVAERPGVMLYFDIEPGLKMLDDPQRRQLLTAIMEYAHFGAVPDFTGPLLSMAWSFVKTSIDRDGERYEKAVTKKKISGITSDFKRNYAPKHGISPDDEEALAEYIRQRLSTSVEESQPSTTVKSETKTSAISESPTTTAATKNTTAVGKGGAGENPSDPPLVDFEQLRQQRLKMLQEHQ